VLCGSPRGEVLTLYKCVRITDVSSLGGVKSLTIRHCRGIKDISALKNVPDLEYEE